MHLEMTVPPPPETPKISIILPVWNSEAYLQEAMGSLLEQTFSDFELLVVDDGSTDRSAAIVEACMERDPRIRLHRVPHRGLVAALNDGIAQAKAAWVARFDADDIASPRWLETVWTAHARHPEAILFHCGYETFGAEARSHPVRPMGRALHALQLSFHCPIAHPGCIYRRSAMQAVGNYAPEDLHAEDYGAWGRLLEQGAFVAVPEILFRRRVHAEAVSQQHLQTQIALTRRLAIAHGQRFMALTPEEAARAMETLTKMPTTDYRDWLWFTTHCLPRLRWLDLQTIVWVILRLGRSFFRKRRSLA